ncbi:SDR family oxidoreductase [Pelovirga terrestris]|uniref:SDR family oxidoreductase n=1 Tax=Pelovirga terrestris TaxID=2771352 RepID=A0A8J6R6H4_9BACT|nr:SDR family oxidoreductase [Pelovirga terrestris]MBD1401394.1 SDR family oxidoreductase [Pelovirga terrestris]
MMDYTIIGCGDIGKRVARELLNQGHKVQATAHDAEGAAELLALGLTPIVANFDCRDDLPLLLLQRQRVYYFMPPQGGGSIDARMANFCRMLNADNCPQRIVYISTSGVYGDCGGDLVTEETPINPQTSRAKRRASAESQLCDQAKELGFDLIILRVTGIYGPGRLPLAQLHKGHQVLRPEDSPVTNRIHSLDLVRICLIAMERGEAGDIFNVCDGQHSSMSEYFTAVADLYDLPRPQQLTWDEAQQIMNPLTLSFLQESRRMTNRHMLEKLGIRLLYPTLEEGLAICRQGDQAQAIVSKSTDE